MVQCSEPLFSVHTESSLVWQVVGATGRAAASCLSIPQRYQSTDPALRQSTSGWGTSRVSAESHHKPGSFRHLPQHMKKLNHETKARFKSGN